ADRRRGGEEVGAGAEAVVAPGERADRAEIDDVAGVVVLERLAREDVDDLARAAPEDAEDRIAGDLLHEAHAARAHDAALLVQDDGRPEDLALVFHPLGPVQARRLVVVLLVVVLEAALTRLIADGAVDGVMEEQQLLDRALLVLDSLALGLDL